MWFAANADRTGDHAEPKDVTTPIPGRMIAFDIFGHALLGVRVPRIVITYDGTSSPIGEKTRAVKSGSAISGSSGKTGRCTRR